MRASFKIFRSARETWPKLFERAAEFMTEVGPERTIGVSHSQEGPEGVVAVWYWVNDPPAKPSGTKPETKG